MVIECQLESIWIPLDATSSEMYLVVKHLWIHVEILFTIKINTSSQFLAKCISILVLNHIKIRLKNAVFD